MSGYESDPEWIAARSEAERPTGDTAAARFLAGIAATHRMFEIETRHEAASP